jgi:citrate synthase
MGEKTQVMVFVLCLYFETGFPLDFFPVLFAVPRVVGWLAHWRQVS